MSSTFFFFHITRDAPDTIHILFNKNSNCVYVFGLRCTTQNFNMVCWVLIRILCIFVLCRWRKKHEKSMGKRSYKNILNILESTSICWTIVYLFTKFVVRHVIILYSTKQIDSMSIFNSFSIFLDTLTKKGACFKLIFSLKSTAPHPLVFGTRYVSIYRVFRVSIIFNIVNFLPLFL